MSTPSEFLKIELFRVVGGLRTPFTLTLDRQRNVVSDAVNQDALNRIMSDPLIMARYKAVEPHEAALARQGLHKHITDEGIVISREKPDEWAVSFDEWLAKDKANPFPGTDDLRLSYFEELDDVVARIAEGTCPGCEVNRLQVTYRVKLRKFLALCATTECPV